MREYLNMSQAALLRRFKSHLRITSDDLDAELHGKLLAAVLSSEHYIGQTILRSRFTETVPFNRTVILNGPETEIESVEVDGEEIVGWKVCGRRLMLPGTGSDVTVIYEAGYACIPEDIVAAILLQGATLFNNVADRVETMTNASQNLLRPYRTWGIDDDGKRY